MDDIAALYRVEPRLIARNGGGWIAVTPRGWPLAVGVIAESQDAACRAFEAALQRWRRIKLLGLADQACGTGAASHLRQ